MFKTMVEKKKKKTKICYKSLNLLTELWFLKGDGAAYKKAALLWVEISA